MDSFVGEEFFELALVAVEYVDVYFGVDTSNTPIGTELPEGEVNVGLVFAVAGYPHTIVALDVRRLREVDIDEALVDIEDGAHACALFYEAEPGAYVSEHDFDTASGLDLGVGGFYVEHRGQVSFFK